MGPEIQAEAWFRSRALAENESSGREQYLATARTNRFAFASLRMQSREELAFICFFICWTSSFSTIYPPPSCPAYAFYTAYNPTRFHGSCRVPLFLFFIDTFFPVPFPFHLSLPILYLFVDIIFFLMTSIWFSFVNIIVVA